MAVTESRSSVLGMLENCAVDLIEDIIINILSRLPTEDLCRLKCVCKQWRTNLVPFILVQRPYVAFLSVERTITQLPFVSLTHRFLYLNNDGLIQDEDQYPHQSALSIIHDYPSNKVILSICNGATVVELLGNSSDSSNSNLAFYSPFSHEATIIQSSYGLENIFSTLLAFNPRISSRHFKIASYCKEHKQPFQIYCSLTKEWRPLKLLPPHISDLNEWRLSLLSNYCVNGRAYKLGYHGCRSAAVMCLDVKEECLWWIDCPYWEDSTRRCNQDTLGETGGRICYALYEPRLYLLSVWTLDDCKWDWKHNIHLNQVAYNVGICWQTISNYRFIFHPGDDEAIFVFRYLNFGRETGFYSARKTGLGDAEFRKVAMLDSEMKCLWPYLCPH